MRTEAISDNYGTHLSESTGWKKANAYRNAVENKMRFPQATAAIARSENFEDIMRRKVMPNHGTSDSTWFTEANIAKFKVIMVFDDSLRTDFSDDLKALFANMFMDSTNYLNVKIVGNQLLNVYEGCGS